MKLLGLIVEYNPFHNGHLYHLKKSKEITNSTHTIAVMSGHFLQRGEPALFDKYTRSEMAVKNGVDLVVELPVIFSCQSAEYFSGGAIKLLNSLNIVDNICFGSEEGNIETLYKISQILVKEPYEFKNYLKKYLDNGLLFAKARSNALFDYINNNKIIDINNEDLYNILNSSNIILGIEYIKSILKLKSSIKPHTITRIKSSYNSENIESEICSATAIRKNLKENNDISFLKDVVPKDTFLTIKNKIDNNFYPVFDENFYDELSFTVLRDYKNLDKYFEVNEGIENKIYQNIFKYDNLNDFILSLKSKRYTLTKIKRTLNNILLGIYKDDFEIIKNIDTLPYVRVLAFNDKGREIIKAIKENSDIKIINKFSDISYNDDLIFNTMINYDIKATNIYNHLYYKSNKNLLKGPMDFYISPKYIKK